MSSVSCVISAVRCQVSSQHVRRREVHVRLPERVRATASQRLQVRQGPWHAAGGVQLLSAHVRRKWKFIQIRMYILFTAKEPGQFHFTIIQLFHWNASSHTNCSTYIFFWYRLLEQGQHSDVKFLVHGQIFTAHRCILSARSEYFTHMFETKWVGKNLITLKHPLVDKNQYSRWLILCDLLAFKKKRKRKLHVKYGVAIQINCACCGYFFQVNPAAFRAILQYFYTGECFPTAKCASNLSVNSCRNEKNPFFTSFVCSKQKK